MLNFKKLFVGFNKAILENINGHLPEGKITFLIGPNGSGKTSLLKTLAQIIPALDGMISTSDHPIYLTADSQFQAGLTGNDLIDLYAQKGSKWFDDSILDYFEIRSLLNFSLESLSSGERQRIFIAAVLSNNSSIVLLDEPLTHLDWNFSLKLKKILNNHARRGRSFLISNHDLNWALSFEDSKTWVLFNKTIFLENSTESVLNDIKLQQVFKIKTEVVSNQNRKIISLSEL